MRKTAPIVITALAAAVLSACTTVAAGQQGVEVASWDGQVENCAKEESNVGTMTVDVKLFPARAITWDANNDPGAERGPYTALSKPASPPLPPNATDEQKLNFSTGQAEMAIPVTLQFDMTTNCDQLKEFYRQYATQDSGWLNSDGSASEGWIKLLTRVISQPAEQAVIAVTQRYPWQRIQNDETIRGEYVKLLSETLPTETSKRTGGVKYFDNFVVQVGKPYPTNEELRRNSEIIQQNQAAADAERIKLTADANARRDAANAEREANEAKKAAEQSRAGITTAQIDAFPNIDAYLRDQCMKTAGCKQYDPAPVIVPPYGTP